MHYIQTQEKYSVCLIKEFNCLSLIESLTYNRVSFPTIRHTTILKHTAKSTQSSDRYLSLLKNPRLTPLHTDDTQQQQGGDELQLPQCNTHTYTGHLHLTKQAGVKSGVYWGFEMAGGVESGEEREREREAERSNKAWLFHSEKQTLEWSLDSGSEEQAGKKNEESEEIMTRADWKRNRYRRPTLKPCVN